MKDRTFSPTKVILYGKFNPKISHLPLLPPSLTHLTIGKSFSGNVDNLPLSLTHLSFVHDSVFNHSIDNLPPHLTHLTMGGVLQSMCGLPPSLSFSSFFSLLLQPTCGLSPFFSHSPHSLLHVFNL